MAKYFNVGDVHVRPGAFFNVDKKGDDNVYGAIDGIVAVIVKAAFGPLGTVSVIGRDDGYEQIYGSGGTTDAIREAFYGGAKTVIACRVGGIDGLAGSAKFTAGSGSISINAKHEGDMPLSATIRPRLTDAGRKECIIYTGTEMYETVTFEKGGDEVSAIKAAFESSPNFAVEVAGGTGTITDAEQVQFTGGKNPTVSNKDYSDALAEIEKYFFNAICVDTEEHEVHVLLNEFKKRTFLEGSFGMAVVAEKNGKSLEERMKAAEGFNSEDMMYVFNATAYAGDTLLEGYQIAAYLAGVYAANPSNQSLTHTVLKRYTKLGERLTNSQIVAAEKRGCLVLSVNSRDEVRIDNAINTLVKLPADKDEGWKKLRRTKTRHEVMYRANGQTDDLVGKIDNDPNGRAVIIGQVQGVLNKMITEGKLAAGEIKESATHLPEGPRAYFDINVIDKESGEFIYLFYKFQFNTDAAQE